MKTIKEKIENYKRPKISFLKYIEKQGVKTRDNKLKKKVEIKYLSNYLSFAF
jgi:hypothetical protein